MTLTPPVPGSQCTHPDVSPSAANHANDHPARMDSNALLRGQKTVEISHNGSTYRLQATRLGKLILTK